MMFKDKKAVAGALINWIPAFIIIIFILIIYLAVTAFIVAEDGFDIFKKAKVDAESMNLVEVENIISFLSIPIKLDNNDAIIKDLVIAIKKDSKYDKQLEQEMKKFMDVFEEKCYIFRTDVVRFGRPVGVMDLTKYGGRWNNRGIQNEFVKEGATFTLDSEEGDIKLELYKGECEL